MLNLDNKKFIAVKNTANGEVSSQTEFHYHQQGNMIWAEYGGGEILKGFLIGKWIDDTQIEFTYQHLNQSLENRLGRCCTTFSLEEFKRSFAIEYLKQGIILQLIEHTKQVLHPQAKIVLLSAT